MYKCIADIYLFCYTLGLDGGGGTSAMNCIRFFSKIQTTHIITCCVYGGIRSIHIGLRHQFLQACRQVFMSITIAEIKHSNDLYYSEILPPSDTAMIFTILRSYLHQTQQWSLLFWDLTSIRHSDDLYYSEILPPSDRVMRSSDASVFHGTSDQAVDIIKNNLSYSEYFQL